MPSEQSRDRLAKLEAKAKEKSLAQLLEQNLELAHRLRLIGDVQSKYERAVEEIRKLRCDIERMKFEILEQKADGNGV